MATWLADVWLEDVWLDDVWLGMGAVVSRWTAQHTLRSAQGSGLGALSGGTNPVSKQGTDGSQAMQRSIQGDDGVFGGGTGGGSQQGQGAGASVA